MSPRDLTDYGIYETNTLIHVSVNSMFFGFIDDMYMIFEPYTGTGSSGTSRVLKIQSQLRMGSSDFEQSYDHVKKILDCMNDTYGNAETQPLPCS